MPPNHQFHEPQNGIYTLLDTATFPNSNRFVLRPATKISSFKQILDVEGSKIVLDTKHQTITKLGANKIQNMFTSKNGAHTAFSLLRPTKIITRQYINLATGKYVQDPLLALTEASATSLTTAKKVDLLEKLSGLRRLDPFILAQTFKNAEKFDGQSVPETHFVVQNSLDETFLTGKANISPKELPIIKTKSGDLLVQVDYPQSIIAEEVYGTEGQHFNKRFYDYKGHRLKIAAKDEEMFEVKNSEATNMFDGAEKLEF